MYHSVVPSPSPREVECHQGETALQIHHQPHQLHSSSGEKSSKIGSVLLPEVCGFSRKGTSPSTQLLHPSEITANLIPAKIMKRKGDAKIRKEGDDT